MDLLACCAVLFMFLISVPLWAAESSKAFRRPSLSQVYSSALIRASATSARPSAGSQLPSVFHTEARRSVSAQLNFPRWARSNPIDKLSMRTRFKMWHNRRSPLWQQIAALHVRMARECRTRRATSRPGM